MVGRFRITITLFLLAISSLISCRPPTTDPSDRLQIMVSIAPQKYFVERIGDDYVTVDVMVPSGAEPHTFEPKPEQLKALSQADAYMQIRIEFEEAWMNKFTAANSRMLLVDTTQDIQRIPLVSEFQENNDETTDSGRNLDPHIWLSPKLVKVQAQTIYEALVKLDAEHQAVYRANLEDFLADLDALDTSIRQTLQGTTNRKFIVFHPGWGYFAQDYQLEQVPIEVGGQEPSAAELAQLIAKAKQENIKVIFAQPQFSQQAAQTVAKEIGGKVLLIDPLSPAWMTNMKEVSDTLSNVMSQRQRIQTAGNWQPLPTLLMTSYQK